MLVKPTSYWRSELVVKRAAIARPAMMTPPPSPARTMRFNLLVLVAVVPLGACAEPAAINHTASLRGRWDRVVVGGHGGDLHTQTPDGVLTRRSSINGRVLDRFDPLPEAGETLLDVVEDEGLARVLASGPGEFFDWEGASVAEPLLSIGRATGIKGARVTNAGIAVLRTDETDGCVVDWIVTSDIDTVLMPAAACAANPCVVADRSANRLLVSTGGATWSVSPTAVDEWLSLGDQCAFDPTNGTLAVAAKGGRIVEAWTSTGTPLWATELPSPIRGLGDLGDGSAIAVTSAKSDGTGQLLLLDALVGDPTLAVETPSAAVGVSGGGQGKVIALRLTNEVHVYQVDVADYAGTGDGSTRPDTGQGH
jgi:hypothetical protein